MEFKHFLLNESKFFLGQKSGDLLSAIQNLAEDAPNLGKRALIRMSQGIVNQIRRVLHGKWEEQDVQYLKVLQKIGVAISKGIDENENLDEVLSSCGMELQGMIDKLGTPINSLGTEEKSENDEPFSPGSELGA